MIKNIWFGFFVSLLVVFTPVYTALSQSQQTGSIVGIVQEREQKDGDRNLNVSLKSTDKLIKKVGIKIPEELNTAVKIIRVPEGCVVTREKAKTNFECPPIFDFNLGLEFPATFKSDFEKFAKKKLELDYGYFDAGTADPSPLKLDIQKTDAVNPVSPNDAAEIPGGIRAGFDFSITPKEGFREGVWRVGIGDKWYEESTQDTYPFSKEELNSLKTDYQERIDQLKKERADSSLPEISFKELEEQLNAFQERFGQIAERLDPNFSYTDKELRRKFFIPEDASGDVQFIFENVFGETLVTGNANTKLIKDTSSTSFSNPPLLTDCTQKIFQGDKLCVCGFFPTQFTSEQLLLDDKPLGRPLAYSSENLIVLPKDVAPGKHIIRWNTLGFNSLLNNPDPWRAKPSPFEQVEFVVLGVEGTIDQNKLFTGQGTTLRIRIIGTEESLPIELQNNTPDIIDLEGGIKQVINTSGGGSNMLERNVRGTKRGNFDIKYKLTTPPCPCKFSETAKPATLSETVRTITSTTTTITRKVSEVCEKIRTECRKIGVKIDAIIARQQKEYAECDKLAGAEKESCYQRVRQTYDSWIAEEEKKFDKCFRSFQSCNAENKEADETNDASSLKLKKDCDDLKKQCNELSAIIYKLKYEKETRLDQCKKFSGDASSLKNCQEITKSYYDPKIQEALTKFDECNKKRRKLCRRKEK